MREVFTMEQIRKMKARTDWDAVKAMTEEDIIKAAKSDPDAQPISKARLKEFRRVHPKSRF